MEQKKISDSADQIEQAAQNLHQSAKTVAAATANVEQAAASVDSNVADGIQPDIRELRIWISELDEKADLRLKRMYWALWALVGLNVISIIVSLIY